jgi:EAL domain-containing protein (putative c-di-GMP-specific phosphodiesterase class I)
VHHHGRERLRHEADGLKAAAARGQAAQGMLAALERELKDIVFLVDRDLRFRFHTRSFAAWACTQPVRISGHALDEPLRPQVASALKPLLADALRGKPGRIELDVAAPDSAGKRYTVNAVPYYGLPQQVTGALVRIGEIAPESDDQREAYVESITEELTGWANPGAVIRHALEQGGFDLFAQDIVALQEGETPERMRELLIRMRVEEKNLLPPGAFLPSAERLGLMTDIDRYVVGKALASQKAALAVAKGPLPLVCINLSRSTLHDHTFAEFVAVSLARFRVPAESLCFELDDGDVRAALADASRVGGELKKLGCRLSLDGFGAAGVGFGHLKAMPVDFLKIDGRIIFELARDPVAVAKVNAIQRICRSLGVRTIAELVESEAALATLRRLGVDYAQGFGVARPRPIAGES